MTEPEIKAKELIEKFTNITKSHSKAKACVILCLKEIIADSYKNFNDPFRDIVQYHESIKKHIESL